MRDLQGGHVSAHLGRTAALAALCLAVALPAASSRAEPPGTPAILLVTPDRGSGPMRVDTVATDPDIDRVLFFVDGEEVGTDRSPPFRVLLDAAPPEASRTLRALALDRAGRPLGEDSLTLGAPAQRFDVTIRALEGDPAAGSVDVEVEATVPPGGRLARIELYRGAQRVASGTENPMRRRVATPDARTDDYLRAVAVLADGASTEDARPLASSAPGERLEVNLVELVALAARRDGTPVRGLGPADFRVLLDGRELPIQRFREAHEVPLTLGLLVDSSTSMWPIVDQTREAAGRFLEHVLAPGDRAFLIDVDTQPRIAHGLTGDPAALAAAFEGFDADGDTALYDALALGTLELEHQRGRRALVVLSDGEDSASHLGLGRCLELARRAGVPVYLVSLRGLSAAISRPAENLRLRALAPKTGGRLFAVTSPDEVDRVYEEIDRELRSQYVLAVAADRALDPRELGRIVVKARARGVTVRVARRNDDGG